jgi:alkanesulfonate monooxygenase SsuD/methylene tetrahydromethanopterin reductase-like flavin-dependent oxidoreductase (luciferase family)
VPDPERIAFSVPIYVADTDERAHAGGRPVIEWLYHKGLRQTPEMVMPPGYMSPGSLRGVLSSGMRGLGVSSYEDLLASGQAVVGSPASVAERLGALYAELGGFGQLIGLFAIGPSTHEQVMRSAELFATEVMPVLRPLTPIPRGDDTPYPPAARPMAKTAIVSDARDSGEDRE